MTEAERSLREFGFRVMRRRDELGLNREELAERCELSVTGLGNLECGRSEPKLLTIMRLCAALECSPDDLVFDAHPPGENGPAGKLKCLMKEARGTMGEKKMAFLADQFECMVQGLKEI